MPEPITDPRPLLLSNIEIHGSRVEFAEAPIVLLCGGLVPIKDHPDDPNLPIASMRHAITQANTSYEIFRPEEIQAWQNDGIYKNLMDFEADLASICSLVVIILESAGSLVELGAFSQLPDLSKNIIAITSSSFENDGSFINLGILRFIAENHRSSVKRYPWDILQPQQLTTEIIQDVISDIEDELTGLGSSQVLKPTQSSHMIVLICEIVRLFKALKEHEILGYLNTLGCGLTKDQLKRKLFLLEQFKLLKKEVYSDSIFYMRGAETYHKLRLALKAESGADALRIEMECLAYYNSDSKHRHRVRAIAQANRGLAK
jgi:hypothetical protein